MQKIIIILGILVCLSFGAEAISIYEVQFTTSAGSDGTYPSPYLGKTVSLEGIVTATDYQDGSYFISEKLNGPWRGILILDRNAKVKRGDFIKVTGIVSEFYGMTCLQEISQTRVISSNNSLPQPVLLTTGQLSNAGEAEAYESVYARFLNVTSTGNKSPKNRFTVTDGSGTCLVLNKRFGIEGNNKIALNAQYASLTGIVIYGYSEFALCPIYPSDYVIQQPMSVQNRSWGRIKSIYR